ncbi:MAG: NAD(P)-dependent oxidoreductase [Planctomycetes bacterium]|nr:NAD(P)-dependent oxidoreductase [Planctomycetota bacterium]
MNAAVTGGAGFLGQALLRLLAGRGGAVRALVRNPKDEPRVRERGAMPIPGDLTVPGACDRLAEPGSVVFHLAARVDMAGRWAEFQRHTIDGTRNLLASVLPRRPARVVYASSAGVYLHPRVRPPVSADRTPARPWRGNPYGRAKLAAEELVRTQCDRAGVSWTILRLGFLYGPGNRAILSHFVPLARAGKVQIIGRGDNRIASLYVDDAAEALVLAAAHPAADRQIYDVASDEHVTQTDYLNGTADAMGLRRPSRHAPARVAMIAAAVVEWLARLTGGSPPFTRSVVMLMGADQQVDCARITRDLGWRPKTRFADGVAVMTQWHREHPARPLPAVIR